MIGKVKREIRKRLENKYKRQYRSLLDRQTTSYDRYIREEGNAWEECEVSRACRANKARDGQQGTDGKILFVEFSALASGEHPWTKQEEEIICFVEERRFLRPETEELLIRLFADNPRIQLVYGDEDEHNSNGKVRMNPWLKPDFSPDTLWSYFYFGSLAAVRRQQLEGVTFPDSADPRGRLYGAFLQIGSRLEGDQVCHCKRILTTVPRIRYWGFEPAYDEIKEELEPLRNRCKTDGVSIIIPSKDNPDLLQQCLESLERFRGGVHCEIVVVDNGSRQENRSRIGKLRERYGFRYVYEPMEFNFSAMCNQGAKESSRELLLFLNDDCQAMEEGWLEKLCAQAELSHVGAVGCKLYYPGGEQIQHCGIYGLQLGPVHKLQFKEDDRIYYDRRNRDIRNCLAVTAACLMVRRQVFEEAGGFSTDLQVAFNDVDLCWRLYQLGYFNCIHNEVTLWHHESVSRGADVGPDKLNRLMREKQLLFERHRELWNRDPYYHPGLTDEILDINYSFAYEYDRGSRETAEPVLLKKLPAKLRSEPCVSPSLEYAGRLRDWELGKEEKQEGFYMQGYAVVLGSDNACFSIEILLLNEQGEYYKITPGRRYRPDLAANMPDQVNVALCGFACVIPLGALPEGIYRIAFLAKDLCSGQYLLRETDREFVNQIEEDNKDE